VVLATEDHSPQRALGAVVVEVDHRVVQEERQPGPVIEHVADGLGQGASRQRRLALGPRAQVVPEIGEVASEAEADPETEAELGDEDFVSPSSPLMSIMSSAQAAARRRGRRRGRVSSMANRKPWDHAGTASGAGITTGKVPVHRFLACRATGEIFSADRLTCGAASVDLDRLDRCPGPA